MVLNGFKNMDKIICISGYFIWPHIGHIEYIREASRIGKMVVILNNDEQQILKYGKVIVPLKERAEILKEMRSVDCVIASIDKDRSVCKTLEKIRPNVFANGGDRTSRNIPEIETCEKLGIQMIFGLGKKIQSSSKLMDKIK